MSKLREESYFCTNCRNWTAGKDGGRLCASCDHPLTIAEPGHFVNEGICPLCGSELDTAGKCACIYDDSGHAIKAMATNAFATGAWASLGRIADALERIADSLEKQQK